MHVVIARHNLRRIHIRESARAHSLAEGQWMVLCELVNATPAEVTGVRIIALGFDDDGGIVAFEEFDAGHLYQVQIRPVRLLLRSMQGEVSSVALYFDFDPLPEHLL
jgi:hypothetical protein